LNAMVLANGQCMFTSQSDGRYELTVPPDASGKITLFGGCDGLAPFKRILEPEEAEYFDIIMSGPSSDGRNMTLTSVTSPSAKEGWIKLSGKATYNDQPLNMIVLANGQQKFTPAESGEYELEVPLDANGEITLFGFCDGLQPYKKILKPGGGDSYDNPDIVMLVPVSTDTVKLAWLPVSSSTTPADEMNYEVHMSKEENFEPSASTWKADVKGDAQADITGLETGTEYYALIVAVDKEWNEIRSNNYGSITTFVLPSIENTEIRHNVDENLGLGQATTQDGVQFVYENRTGAILPEVGSVLFINAGEDVYLRKVSAVNTTADNIVVQTGDAELAEVFDQATVNTKVTLFDMNQVSDSRKHSDGSRHTVMRWKNDLLVAEQTDYAGETDDVSIFPGQKSGCHEIRIKRDVEMEEEAGVSASISFTPELDTEISWIKSFQGIKITRAKVIARGTFSANIKAYYNFSASGSVEKEIPKFIIWRGTQRYMLGTVPVYQIITLSLKAELKAEAKSEIKAEANADASAGIEMGVIFNPETDSWDIIPLTPSFSKSLTVDVSLHGEVHGKVRLIPNIQVEFYRMLAADLSLEPILTSDIQAKTISKSDILQNRGYLASQLTQLDAALQAEAFIGVSFGVFSKKISLLEKFKFYTSPKWILFTLPKLEVKGGSGKVGEPVTLTATATDGTNNPFDTGSIEWIVFPDKGILTPNGKSATFTATEEDTYTIFFSGHSRLGDPIGRQFAYTEITFSDSDNEQITISGMVTDYYGYPLSGIEIKLSLTSGNKTTLSGEDGSYTLSVSDKELPEHFVINAWKDGYVPSTRQVDKKTDVTEYPIDFKMEEQTPDIVILEIEPDVYHLGDGRAEGTINSQFQKEKDGTTYKRTFEIDDRHLDFSRGEISFLAKGVQNYDNKLIINDAKAILNSSPPDGSFGTQTFKFEMDILLKGTNTLKIESVKSSESDFDDFEFTNIVIRFFDED